MPNGGNRMNKRDRVRNSKQCVIHFQTKVNPNERSNNNTAADSSAEDDSDDDGEQTGEQKENPRETHGEVSIVSIFFHFNFPKKTLDIQIKNECLRLYPIISTISFFNQSMQYRKNRNEKKTIANKYKYAHRWFQQ